MSRCRNSAQRKQPIQGCSDNDSDTKDYKVHKKNLLKVILFAWAFILAPTVLVVNAAQSLTTNGTSQYTVRSLANTAPYTSINSWRLEMRLTNIGSSTDQKVVDNAHFFIRINGSTGSITVATWDNEIAAFTFEVNGSTGHLSDIVIRVQKDAPNSRFTVEAWDSNGTTRFASGSTAGTGMTSRNFGNTNFYVGARSIEQAGSAGNYFSGRIAFMRWYSTLVSYESSTKPLLYPNSAGLLQMEYEGNLNDSSGNSQTFTDVGTVTYNTTSTINPIASAGLDVGGRTAGVTFQVSATNSAAGDVGPITSYSWTRTAGSGTIVSASSATTDITGIAAGQSTFQVQVSDGTNTATDTVDAGVVNVNGDGTVAISNATHALLLGPLLPAGSAGSQVMPLYNANEEASYEVHNNFPIRAPRWNPLGNVSTTSGSPTVTGSSGTLFTKHVTPEIPLYINGVTYIIASINSDTSITLTTNASATVTNTGNWDQNGSNEHNDYGGYWNYYDGTLTAYGAYYRTGLDKWLTVARKMADSWWTFSDIDYGAVAPASGPAPRSAALGGLILRAADGKPEYWDYCYNYAYHYYHNTYVIPRIDYPGFYFGTREGGYALLYMVWLSQVLPDTYTLYGNGTLAASTGTATDGATKRATLLSESLNGAMNLYVRLLRSDGSWRWGDPFTDPEGTLSGTISSSDTSLTLTDASTFPSTVQCSTGFICDLKIDNEYMTYTTKTGNVLSGVTRAKFTSSAASHTSGVVVRNVTAGNFEQLLQNGVGVVHAFRDLLRILQGNGTYATEYNTIRNALILQAAEGIAMAYSSEPVVDTPSVNSRMIVYFNHGWDMSVNRDGMPNTLPGWPCLNGCFVSPNDLVDLNGARQTIANWAHTPGTAYHYSGVPWFKDWTEEVLSSNFGKTGYAGSIGTSDGHAALMDFFTRTGTPARSLKDYNEWYRAIGSSFAYRIVPPVVPANRAPWVSVAGGDRIFANGTSNPSFTARGVDPEGTSVSYSWAFSTCTGTLSGASTATVTVTSALTNDTTCALKVTVTDATSISSVRYVTYRTANPTNNTELRPPVAVVPSQNVSLSAGTTSSSTALDLTGSTVFGGRSIKGCRWVQVDGTDATTISNMKSCNPTVSSLANGQTYVFFGSVYDNVTRTVDEPGADGIFVRITVGGVGSIIHCNWSSGVRCSE